MSVLSSFWVTLLETIYLPILNFFGYNSALTFAILILFVMLQIWVFYHLFLKPFIYILKIFVNFIFKNNLWSEVEVDERKNRK